MKVHDTVDWETCWTVWSTWNWEVSWEPSRKNYRGVECEVRVDEVLSDLGARPETRVCTFTVALLTIY